MLSFHQPSPSMFALLDVALVIAQGSVAFRGPPAAAGTFMAARGLPCPEGMALAEHMLHAVSDPASLQQMLGPTQVRGGAWLCCVPNAGAAASPGCLGLKHASCPTALAAANRWLPSNKGRGQQHLQGSPAASKEVLRVAILCSTIREHLQAPSQEDVEQGWAGQPGQKASAPRDLPEPIAHSAVQHTPEVADEALQQPASPQQLPARQRCPPGASLVQQLHILFWRTLTDVVRNPALLLMHCALSVMMGIFCGLIFMNLGIGIAGTQNRAGGLQLWCMPLWLHDLTTHGPCRHPDVCRRGCLHCLPSAASAQPVWHAAWAYAAACCQQRLPVMLPACMADKLLVGSSVQTPVCVTAGLQAVLLLLSPPCTCLCKVLQDVPCTLTRALQVPSSSRFAFLLSAPSQWWTSS